MFATHLHTTSKTYTDSETQALRDLYVSDSAGQLLVERVERLELSSTAWKAVVLPVEPYPQQPWSEEMDLNHRVTTRGNGFKVRRFQPLSHLPITTSKLSIAKQLWSGVCRSNRLLVYGLRTTTFNSWPVCSFCFGIKNSKPHTYYGKVRTLSYLRFTRDKTATIRLRSRVFKRQWSVDNSNLYNKF